MKMTLAGFVSVVMFRKEGGSFICVYNDNEVKTRFHFYVLGQYERQVKQSDQLAYVDYIDFC